MFKTSGTIGIYAFGYWERIIFRSGVFKGHAVGTVGMGPAGSDIGSS